MPLLPNAAQVFGHVPRFFRRHKLMTAWMRLTGEDTLQLVPIRDNAFGYADLKDGFLRLIVVDGEFEPDFFRIADPFLELGGVFFDVGANHGLLSLGLASKFSDRVAFHLFEPNPYLCETLERSKVSYPAMKAKVNTAALSDFDGSINIFFKADHLGASHVVKDGGVPVPCMKLDSYLTEQQIDVVDFMKMDVEGHELSVLRGSESALKEHRIKAIYFEYCEKWLVRAHAPELLLQYLDSVGYEVCFCHQCDLDVNGGKPICTLKEGLRGHGVPLIPLRGHTVNPITDLLAIPRENLAALP